MSRNRQDLIDEALANLGIVQQAYTGVTRTRAELVSEALANLGIIQQAPTVGLGSKNRTDLINKVLFNLGVLSEGRSATAAETASVTAELDPQIANLSANAIISLADTNAIPNQYFLPLAAIIADSMRDEFGLDGEEAKRVAADAADARRNLKGLTQTFLVDQKLDSIMAELQARMVVTVATPVVTVPTQYFSALAAIVANSCKGKFEIAPGTAARVATDAADGERTLKNLTRVTLVERNIDQILADLAEREIVYLIDTTAIPDGWFTHLAWIVADRCKGKFELDDAIVQRAAGEGITALASLREMTRGRPSYNTLRTSYM